MDWDALRHPVGSLPARVYWIRRAGLLGALAVLAVTGLLAAGAGHTAPRRPARAPLPPAPAPTGQASPAAGPAAPAASTPAADTATASTAPGACTTGSLELQVHASADSYPSGGAPTFTATLRNSGPACAAPGPLVFTVLSGGDRVWSSGDCDRGAGPPTQLTANGAAGVSRTWPRTRSAPGCPPSPGTAAPGTYRVTATWAGVTSPEAVFHLQ